MRTRPPTRLLSRSIALLVAVVLVASGCGGGDAEADDATTTSSTTAPETTTPEPPEDEDEDEDEDEGNDDPDDEDSADADIPGGLVMLDGKSILLDGFVGVRIPEGWDVTSTALPQKDTAPEGEVDLDPDALDQVLVINPVAEPRGGSLALVHYSHSEAVPDLTIFSDAVRDLLSSDGSQIGEPQAGSVGGEDSFLYEVQSASGATGVMVTMTSGGEYFFVLGIVTNPDYSNDLGTMLSSISFEPAALGT